MNLLTPQQLSDWLDQLAQEFTLLAPAERAGVVRFHPVQQASQAAKGFPRTAIPAKEVFFPPTERLFRIAKTGQEIHLTETLPDDPAVLFGIRPCDARGLLALDALFLDTAPADPYYARRRANTTLIGLACREARESCFCASLAGAPDDPTGMDILLAEVDGDYAVKVISEKGAALLNQFAPPAASGRWAPESLWPAAPAQSAVPIPALEQWPPRFKDDFWAEMAERCLSCRICAYVCPTCRCFNVRDESQSSKDGHAEYERLRCWDSCNSIPYRRVAGGHNPRFGKNQRLRNRFFCKFDYFPRQYGPLACTGCGRCIDACPVNVDITEVLGYINAAKEQP
jgi:ferredoxin